jgi:hypothetical protein
MVIIERSYSLPVERLNPLVDDADVTGFRGLKRLVKAGDSGLTASTSQGRLSLSPTKTDVWSVCAG